MGEINSKKVNPLTSNLKPKTLLPLVVIVGETASGKSDLAIRLATKLNGEIINADSWTVRKEVNIGTAKPTAEERTRIPHYLIDVAEPCGDFTAADFKRLANQAIEDILSRGRVPIMVGGTGLYIDSVIYDFGFLPAGDRGERESMNKLTVEELIVLAKQQELDLSRIDTRNKRRVIRLIETGGAAPARKEMRLNTLIIGIRTDKAQLAERIKERVDEMIKKGLEREVRGLANKYGWDCEALKGIGYAEWREFFEGGQNLEETKKRIISSSLNLAKRQRTWFKRNSDIKWFNSADQAYDFIATHL
jgi:tRNA dimethylallyltransferase